MLRATSVNSFANLRTLCSQAEDEDVPLAVRKRRAIAEPASSPFPMARPASNLPTSPTVQAAPLGVQSKAAQPKEPQQASAKQAGAKHITGKQCAVRQDSARPNVGKPPIAKPPAAKQAAVSSTHSLPRSVPLAASGLAGVPMPPLTSSAKAGAPRQHVPSVQNGAQTQVQTAAPVREPMGPPPARKRPALPDRSALPPKKRRATAAGPVDDGKLAKQSGSPGPSKQSAAGQGTVPGAATQAERQAEKQVQFARITVRSMCCSQSLCC